MISRVSSGITGIQALLHRHPRIQSVEPGEKDLLCFEFEGRERRIAVGEPNAEIYGLLEAIDNNPVVCADSVSVPGPAATLALIAATPMVLAGILADAPVFVFSGDCGLDEVDGAFQRLGWEGGAVVHYEPVDVGSVIAASAMMSITTPENLEEIEEAFDERFGRSFFVVRKGGGDWSPEQVAGKPVAAYSLSISRSEPTSLLTVRLMADANGKCGAAQVVHAMNVMCGFEETLGLLG